MGRKVFHVIHIRSFKNAPQNEPHHVLAALTCWLERYGFRCRIKSSHYATGRERGINVNNVAKFKLRVIETENNGLLVTFEHYAKMKVRTYIAVGALTLGISTGFSVGTLGLIIEEADSLTSQFWRFADSLFSEPGLITEIKRWTSDGKGNWEIETVYPKSDCKISNIARRSVIQE
eukprot:Phypoly_transcript_20936.p1 GENE.Phypoly_transcript_20936~~Phypoly_transcript_20936.p1  ORF type:complete len:191 (+),score=6.27 Phypoly_transcript_20936:48-575(+)